MHLFEHLVDGIAFLPLPLGFLVARANSLSLAGFLCNLGADFRRNGFRLNTNLTKTDIMGVAGWLAGFMSVALSWCRPTDVRLSVCLSGSTPIFTQCGTGLNDNWLT